MSPPKTYLCPCCGKQKHLLHFACEVAAKGGRTTTPAKIEANRQRALARWKKYREEKGKQ